MAFARPETEICYVVYYNITGESRNMRKEVRDERETKEGVYRYIFSDLYGRAYDGLRAMEQQTQRTERFPKASQFYVIK